MCIAASSSSFIIFSAEIIHKKAAYYAISFRLWWRKTSLYSLVMATHSTKFNTTNSTFCHAGVCSSEFNEQNVNSRIQVFWCSRCDLRWRFSTFRRNAALTQETEWTADSWIWGGHDPSKHREQLTQRQSVWYETRALNNCDLYSTEHVQHSLIGTHHVNYVSWRHLLINVFQMAKLIIGIDVESL